MPFPKFLRRKVAAQYLREHWGLPCTPNTLAKLAVVGGGPSYRRAGRIPLYSPENLDRYAEKKLGKEVRSTSDYGSQGHHDHHSANHEGAGHYEGRHQDGCVIDKLVRVAT